MPQKWSLKIILLFYCFLSPICEGQECGSDSTINDYDYGTEYENNYEPFSCPCDKYPCENEGSCSNLNATSYVCKCEAGYEGENCEKNICDDLPSANVYQCETSAGDPICIRTDKICNGNATHKNEDCPNGEDELRCVVGCPELWKRGGFGYLVLQKNILKKTENHSVQTASQSYDFKERNTLVNT